MASNADWCRTLIDKYSTNIEPKTELNTDDRHAEESEEKDSEIADETYADEVYEQDGENGEETHEDNDEGNDDGPPPWEVAVQESQAARICEAFVHSPQWGVRKYVIYEESVIGKRKSEGGGQTAETATRPAHFLFTVLER